MFGLLLVFVGIGAACVLLYNVAVYALPFAIGVWVGFAVLHWGGGPILGIVIGLVAGGMAYGVGEQIFEHSHSVPLRLATAIVFVAPAVYVGYSGTLQLSALAMSSSFWEHVLAVIAAISVGSTTFIRLVAAQQMLEHHKLSNN